MKHVTFGKTGLQVSPLGFGAAPAAFLATEQASAAQLVQSMLDRGMNVIDTAAMYPGSEAFIGNHLAHRRKDYVLISKCGTKINEIDAPLWSPSLISQSVDRALKLTRAESLDVMLLHSCDIATLKKGDALAALVKAREAGKVKFVGYSGDNEAAAFAATLADIAVIETSINVVDQVNIDKVLPVTIGNNIGVIAKRPIANAAWKDLAEQRGTYKNYAAEYTRRLAKLPFKPEDIGFTRTFWPEVALRFTIGIEGIHTSIVGTTNPVNAMANIDYASRGPLPIEAIRAIRAAFAKADPSGEWTGQT